MKKLLLPILGIIFAMESVAFAFHINLGRDPFMDLLRLQELKRKEFKEAVKKRVNKLQEEINSLLASLKVTMVVSSKDEPSMKAALIVGPSGVPMVVVKGQELKKGVYVSDIKSDGVEISVESGKVEKKIFLKMAQ